MVRSILQLEDMQHMWTLASSRERKQSIIAMKGPPFTRKTKYARFIAASLKCPVLSLEDFLDFLHPEHLQTCPSSNTSTPPLPQPQDLAFQIICQITKSHLSPKTSDNIVIDSSLSSRSHFNQLIELASSLQNTRLVIVECMPKNKYAWETKFQQFIDRNPGETQKWYKAKNLYDVKKAIKEYYDETSDGFKVSKLVLDPLSDPHDYDSLTSSISTHLNLNKLPLMEAVDYMITRKEDDDNGHIMDYEKWKKSQHLHSRTLDTRDYCEEHGHSITKYLEAPLGYEANCMACGDQVMAQAYSCNYCNLTLHKQCAESVSTYRDAIILPTCASCRGNRKFYSRDCSLCLFLLHLVRRQMPTIIIHECEKHFLCIMLQPYDVNRMEVYQCSACGESGRHIMYSCEICGIYYDSECLNLPSLVEHVHGGHHHHMRLKFYSDEAEDYMCDECVGNCKSSYLRDPRFWFYSCEECPYEAHLYCIVKKSIVDASQQMDMSLRRHMINLEG